MLYRSIVVAIILLLSWFTYSSMRSMQQLSLQLNTIQKNIAEKPTLSLETQQETSQKIGEIQAYIASQIKIAAEKKKVEQKLAAQQSFSRFHDTFATVMKAELLRVDKNYKGAASLLKGTKKEIWKAGDVYKDKQKDLRSLMPKIDAVVNAWNKGDGSATAKSVYSTLDKIIQEKGK